MEPDKLRAWAANDSLRADIIYLTLEQQRFVQDLIPSICARGGWMHRVCSAAHDHVHVLLDIDPTIHGEKIRRLLKRWIGEALTERWSKPAGGTWWAKEGSNIAIHDAEYLNNAFNYIEQQRAR